MQRAEVKPPEQKFFSIPDVVVLLLIATAIYAIVAIGDQWRAEYNPTTEIHLSFWALPYYTMLSGMRGLVAYLLSLTFSLVVGYTAAKSKKAERFIIPMLDILQSIPVLGFLPALVLGLVSLFPKTNTGLELAAIIAIFTGQAWNMTFSFYSSLKSIPSDFIETTRIIGLNWRQRLVRLELPYSAVNLAWNSLLSMAGGWFFLNVSEAVTLGKNEYRLPGVGSYMSVAIQQGNGKAMIGGILAMVLLIIFMDFIIWRPVLAWVQRFRLEDVPGTGEANGATPLEPIMKLVIRESAIVRWLKILYRRFKLLRRQKEFDEATQAIAASPPVQWVREARKKSYPILVKILEPLLTVAIGIVILWGSWKLLLFLFGVSIKTWVLLLRSTLWTFLRVIAAILISTLWAVPAGIWIGTSPKRIRIAQPIIQVMASFPAPMLYPIALTVIFYLGINFEWGAMFLMLLGVQWYVLFNVLAGALRIPRELKYALDLMDSSRWDIWKTLYLPSVFPALVTGWVTAAGGAWNASIVAEYLAYQGKILRANGLGAAITEAAASEDFRILAASLTLMVFFVLLLNRTVWTRVYQLSHSRFRMEV